MNTFFKSTFFKKNETLLAITALILSGVLFLFMPNCQLGTSEMVTGDWTFAVKDNSLQDSRLTMRFEIMALE